MHIADAGRGLPADEDGGITMRDAAAVGRRIAHPSRLLCVAYTENRYDGQHEYKSHFHACLLFMR